MSFEYVNLFAYRVLIKAHFRAASVYFQHNGVYHNKIINYYNTKFRAYIYI